MKVSLIVNPAAGRGRASRSLSRIRRAFAAVGVTDIRLTAAAGDEERLAEAALADGAGTIVAVGGDGTSVRIANAIIAAGSSCRLGLVPVGTGNDFAKTLGVLRLDYNRIAALCTGQSVARMDVGRVEGIYFLNSCGFGIDPAVLEATLRTKWLTGDALYIWTALRKLFTYGGVNVEETSSHGGSGAANATGAGQTMMIIVSNGPNLGGAFRIAPEASVCDGQLDVHYFGDASPMRRLRIFIAALRGTHSGMSGVRFERRFSLGLKFNSPQQMEVDGELRTAKSAELLIECIPGALSVVAAPGYPR
jgi:diacylglycerol kinase (ATP)